MKNKTLSILKKVAKGKLEPEIAQKKLFDLFGFTPPFCSPPNITYCKQAIYPEFDCETCKWKTKKE